jgi:ATP-dependent Clp protease ATP-binding subunit ClpB
MEKIVVIQLNQLVKRLREREITLTWNDEVLKFLAEEGYDQFYGARPLKRLIQQDVVNLLSKAILEGKIVHKDSVKLIMKDGRVHYTTK